MAYSEFPHGRLHEEDFHELIALYKRAVADYSGTLKSISDLSDRLTKYEQDVNKNLIQIRDEFVPNAVNNALTKEMAKYQADLQAIRNGMDQTNSKLDALRALHDKDVDRIYVQIGEAIADLRVELNREINTVDAKLQSFQNFINTEIAQIKSDSETNMNELLQNVIYRDSAVEAKSKDYADHIYRVLSNRLDAIDLEIDKASIKWVWDHGCNYGGYSAIEWYRDTTITAGMWHEMNFSALDWYVRGKEVFSWFKRKYCYMYSPITGRYEDVRMVMYELCAQIGNGLTAEEYEKLKITAEEYDALKISAHEYDWNGKEKVNVLEND